MMLTGEKGYRSSFVSAHFKLQTCSSFTEAIMWSLILKKIKYEKLPVKANTH